jgi:lipopolysaccharide transport system permease protein
MTTAAAASRATYLIGGHRRRRPVDLAELWAYRELLYFLVWRDAKVRYRQTVLGATWALVQPGMTMVVFDVFFGRLAQMPSDGVPYRLFALSALVPWTYFATALGAGAHSLVGQQHLIGKVYFPRLLMPLAAVTTPLIDFAIALVFLFGMTLWHGVVPGSEVAWLPLYVVLALATAFTASVWTAALNVEYRDVRFVLPFAIQFWMFATPVAYPASLVPERWRVLYGLNPMATVVEGFRAALLGTAGPQQMVIPSIVTVALLLVFGMKYFRRVEGTFADVI